MKITKDRLDTIMEVVRNPLYTEEFKRNYIEDELQISYINGKTDYLKEQNKRLDKEIKEIQDNLWLAGYLGEDYA